MARIDKYDRLGESIRYPIVDNFSHVSGEDCVIQDLEQNIMTNPRERVRRPYHGGGLGTAIWENLDTVVNRGKDLIKKVFIQDSRVQLQALFANKDEENFLVTFRVDFVILETNTPVRLLVAPYQNIQGLK